VIDKHSLQQKFKQNATAVVTWNNLIRRVHSFVSTQTNIKKNRSQLHLDCTEITPITVCCSSNPKQFFFCFSCGATAPPPLGAKFRDHAHLRHTTFCRTALDEGSTCCRDYTWPQTTFTVDKHPCPRQDENPQSQQTSCRWNLFRNPYLYHKIVHILNYLCIFKWFQLWCICCIKSGKSTKC
jgi:hypothetical protein